MKYHDNSREAFQAMMPAWGTLDAMIIKALDEAGRDGMITEKLAIELGRKIQSVSGNVAHLKDRKLVVENGDTRKTSSGRNAAVLVCAWHADPEPIATEPKSQTELF